MSKRKRRRSTPLRQEAPAPHADTAPSGRSRQRWVVGAVVVVAAGLLIHQVVQRRLISGGETLPGRPAELGDVNALYEDFVGSDECEECHKAEYDAWKGSTHGNAGGLPGEVRIIAPFNGEPIRFRDALVTPLTSADGRLVFIVEHQDGAEQVFEVDGVVGGGHMAGGGTQAYFSEYPDGTVRFIPFDYIRDEGVWFCQTAGRSNQGWTPITPDMVLSDCNDWPPSRVLGSYERFANCQQCHGSQITLEYDAAAKTYLTRFTTLAVNCESCHGPGRRHIEIADSDTIDATTDIGMEALATFDEDESLHVCFQCHAVKEELQPGYISGKPRESFFSDLLPLLSSRPYFPDGRIRQFAYQQQHLYSDCYLNGVMTCVDCHDPHSQRYRDIWGEPLVGRFSDGQCLDCHASKAEELEVDAAEPDSLWDIGRRAPSLAAEVERHPAEGRKFRINSHTRHRVGTRGGRCIDCHMPYLQEPDVGGRLRYSRSDHTIPIPRPGLDAMFGIENACVKCHRGRSRAEVEAKVREWYGELKPPKALITGLIESRRVQDRREAARLMLEPQEDYVAPLFTNLSYFMLTYLTPDMPTLEVDIVERLKELAESDNPDLQALALASLHFARGEDRRVRSYLEERLEDLGNREDVLRRRWVWVLSFRGEVYSTRNEHQAALKAFRKAAEILPDDPWVLRDLGTAYGNLGDYAEALRHLRRSLAVDPNQPITRVSLAVALIEKGDIDAGFAEYRQALELNPYEPRSYLSLGNTLMLGRNVDEAVETYRRVIDLDPSMAPAHFALAQIHYQLGRYEEAIAALEAGLEYDRNNTGARQMLDALRSERTRPQP